MTLTYGPSISSEVMTSRVSRFGSGRPEFHNRSAKLLATMAMSLPGTPLIYQGDEIGMTNFPFTNVSQYDDIGVHNLWKDLVLTNKVTAADYLSNNALTSRDNSRTPCNGMALRTPASQKQQGHGWPLTPII